MEQLLQFIIADAYILVPCLYIIGAIIKGLEKVSDKYIPVILLALGVVGACFLMGFAVTSVIQGILLTGATILCNQIPKQLKKGSE